MRKDPVLVLATNNPHKIKEISAILKTEKVKCRIRTLENFPSQKPVRENKKTIEGNAVKKAKEIAARTACWALADDTGLFVAALRGKPGVYSARFAGPACSYRDNNRKLLRLLSKTPDRRRTAVFRTVAALCSPTGRVMIAEGRLNGLITRHPRGTKGFGYDPVFLVPRIQKTFAEMTARQKNEISHRALAFRRAARLVRRFVK